MSEIRGILTGCMEDVRNGKMPLDPAERIDKLAHRHVMDRYADDKEARRVGDIRVAENLAEAQKKIKNL